jgi:2'-5' RNA ligase
VTELRLFVALELPEPVRESLSAWAGEVAAVTGPGLRVVGPESLHVTLCFLGSVLAERVEAIGRACEAVRGFPVGELGGGRALWLPARRPRVLALQLEDPHGSLGVVQGELARELAALGVFRAETRAYLPHVTVARVARGARVRGLELPAVPEVSFAAERVVLYCSHLGAGPARYESLHQVKLSRR